MELKHGNGSENKEKIGYEEKSETIKLQDLEQIEPVFRIKNNDKFREETKKRDFHVIMKMTNLLLKEDEDNEKRKDEEIGKLCE